MQKIAFINGRFFHSDESHISSFDRAVHFGDAVYETIYCYHQHLLCLNDHLIRLKNSLDIVGIPEPKYLTAFENIAHHLMQKNTMSGEGYLFVCISRGVTQVRSLLTSGEPTMIVQAFPYIFQHASFKKATFIYDERWQRPWIKSTSLLTNTLAAHAAHNNNCDLAILCDKNNFITEGTHYNVFLVTKENSIITTPNNGSILPGCTRAMILSIAQSQNIPCEVRPIHQNDISDAAAIFGSSSLMHIAPIRQINDIFFEENPIVQKLQALYSQIVTQY
ncbi:MAG: aminotransferase class IV [Alphaproteobacteria bacterium]|nr:aminotransferase class IV [Alphaproteobacteria bacterium]